MFYSASFLLILCLLKLTNGENSERTVITNSISIAGSTSNNGGIVVSDEQNFPNLEDGISVGFAHPVVQRSGYKSNKQFQTNSNLIPIETRPLNSPVQLPTNIQQPLGQSVHVPVQSPVNLLHSQSEIPAFVRTHHKEITSNGYGSYSTQTTEYGPPKPKNRIRIIPQTWRSIPFEFDVPRSVGMGEAHAVIRGTDSLCDETQPFRLAVVIHTRSRLEKDFHHVLAYLGRVAAYLPRGSQVAVIQNGKIQVVFEDFQNPIAAIESLLWNQGDNPLTSLEEDLSLVVEEDARHINVMNKALLILLDYTPAKSIKDIRSRVVSVTPNVAVVAIAEHFPINDRELNDITHDYKRVLYLKKYFFLNKLSYKTVPWFMSTICFQAPVEYIPQEVLRPQNPNTNPYGGDVSGIIDSPTQNPNPYGGDESGIIDFPTQNPNSYGGDESGIIDFPTQNPNSYGGDESGIIDSPTQNPNSYGGDESDITDPHTPNKNPYGGGNVHEPANGKAGDKYPDAVDYIEWCCYWAQLDECHTNPSFMRVKCQKSCGTPGCAAESRANECTVDLNIFDCPWTRNNQTIATTQPSTESAEVSSTERPPYGLPDDKVDIVDPNSKPIEVIDVIPPKKVSGEDRYPEAMDSNPYCCYWAQLDECITNHKFMRVNCQKSCGTPGCTDDRAAECVVDLNVDNCVWIRNNVSEELVEPKIPISNEDQGDAIQRDTPWSHVTPVKIIHGKPVKEFSHDNVQPVDGGFTPIEVTDVVAPVKVINGNIITPISTPEPVEIRSVLPTWIDKVQNKVVDKYPNAVDQNEFCCYWAQAGVCHSNPAMRAVCQKSCGTPGCFPSDVENCVVHLNIVDCARIRLAEN